MYLRTSQMHGWWTLIALWCVWSIFWLAFHRTNTNLVRKEIFPGLRRFQTKYDAFIYGVAHSKAFSFLFFCWFDPSAQYMIFGVPFVHFYSDQFETHTYRYTHRYSERHVFFRRKIKDSIKLTAHALFAKRNQAEVCQQVLFLEINCTCCLFFTSYLKSRSSWAFIKIRRNFMKRKLLQSIRI